LSCSTCIAAKNSDSVCAVIFNKKKGGKYNSNSYFKIFPLDQFTGCIYNGLGGDIQMKIQETIIESVNFYGKYNHNIPMDYLIKLLSDKNQFYTQYAYTRLLGVKFLIMGIDDILGPQLYKGEVSGYFSSYQICVLGEKENLISSYLIKQIKEKLIKLSSHVKTTSYIISIFKNFLEADIKPDDIQIIISTKNKIMFKQLTSLEIEFILNFSN
jgi:20S proteasome subunit alpha 1